MKILFRSLSFGSLFLIQTIFFGMDQPPTLIVSHESILDKLMRNNYQNERKIIFGLIKPPQINALRKTSKKLSEFFSFCNPSPNFIECHNPYISPKDYKGIFFTALYYDNYPIAEILVQKNKINHRYRIPKTYYAIYPIQIIEKKDTEKIPLLLKECLASQDPYKLSLCEVNPLLIGCIGRNNINVERIVDRHPETLSNDDVLLRVLKIVMRNKDTRTLTLLVQHKNIQSLIDSTFIWESIVYGSIPLCNCLIATNLCNINQKITSSTELTDEGFVYVEKEPAPMETISTLLDLFNKEKKLMQEKFGNQFVVEIEKILMDNGAQTLKELEKTERDQKLKSKFFFNIRQT